MSESPNFDIDRIAEELRERLGATVPAAYLYGSVARGRRRARDLDLLFVIATKDHAAVFAAIADIQTRNKILIHPTVVSPRELETNSLFQELVDSSKVLWQTV